MLQQIASAFAGGSNAVGNIWGTVYANRANTEQARLNRAFQEEMSNTAYRRAMQDMEAAGLNPMLSLTHQASTPSGAQATYQAPQFGDVVGSAMQALKLFAELDAVEAQTEKTRTEKLMTEAALPGVAAQSRSHISNANVADRLAQYLAEEKELGLKWKREEDKYHAENTQNDWYQKKMRAEESGFDKEIRELDMVEKKKTWESNVRLRLTDAILRELEVPEARAEARAWESRGDERTMLRDAQGGASLVGDAVGAASMIRNMFRGTRRSSARDVRSETERVYGDPKRSYVERKWSSSR